MNPGSPFHRAAFALPAFALGFLVLAGACKGAEGAGPVEPLTVECPSTGDRTCRSSADCAASQHCTGDRCFLNQSGCPCSEPQDCGTAAHCNRGQCYANRAGNPCAETSQCGPRAHCTVDTCYVNASGSPCGEPGDCGSGSSCVSGTCN